MSLKVGDIIPFASVKTIDGFVYNLIGNRESHPKYVHLQLRRHSGCAICNLHLRNYSRNLDQIQSAQVQPLIVFISKPELIKENQGTAEWAKPLKLVADPDRVLYKAVGAELSAWSLLTWRFWKMTAANMSKMSELAKTLKLGGEPKTQRPMDILIDVQDGGRIKDFKYGEDPYDSWTAEDLLSKLK